MTSTDDFLISNFIYGPETKENYENKNGEKTYGCPFVRSQISAYSIKSGSA